MCAPAFFSPLGAALYNGATHGKTPANATLFGLQGGPSLSTMMSGNNPNQPQSPRPAGKAK